MSHAVCHGELPALFIDILPVCGQKWLNSICFWRCSVRFQAHFDANVVANMIMVMGMGVMTMITMAFQNREPVCEPLHAHVPVLLERLRRLWENLCEDQKYNLRSASHILYYITLHYICCHGVLYLGTMLLYCNATCNLFACFRFLLLYIWGIYCTVYSIAFIWQDFICYIEDCRLLQNNFSTFIH